MLFVLLSITVDAREIIDKPKINCFIKHLKAANKLDSDFPELSVTNEVEDCNQVIKDVQNESLKKVALVIRKNKDVGSQTPCIMDDLRAHTWTDDFFLQAVYQFSNNLSANEKKKKIDEADARSIKFLEQSIKSCFYQKEFGEMFDELFKQDESSSEEDNEPLEDYCARKYVVDKSLVDSDVYTVVLNPKNIDVTNVDCKTVLKKVTKDFEEVMAKKFKDDDDMSLGDTEIACAMQKYSQGNFVDRIFVVFALSEINITDEQKQDERKKFIGFMTKITDSFLTCQQD